MADSLENLGGYSPDKERTQIMIDKVRKLSKDNGYGQELRAIEDIIDVNSKLPVLVKLEEWNSSIENCPGTIFTIFCNDDNKFNNIIKYIKRRSDSETENIVQFRDSDFSLSTDVVDGVLKNILTQQEKRKILIITEGFVGNKDLEEKKDIFRKSLSGNNNEITNFPIFHNTTHGGYQQICEIIGKQKETLNNTGAKIIFINRVRNQKNTKEENILQFQNGVLQIE